MALAGPLLYTLIAPMLLQPIVSPTLYSLLGMLFMWLLTGSIVFIIYAWERQSVSSIGLQRLSRKLLILAILLGILLGLAVPVMAFLASRLFPVLPAQTTTPPTNAPAWLVLLGVVTIAITEEVIFRAYILERLQQATGSV
jgi:membrane protease YdiL (CAAX protease family)